MEWADFECLDMRELSWLIEFLGAVVSRDGGLKSSGGRIFHEVLVEISENVHSLVLVEFEIKTILDSELNLLAVIIKSLLGEPDSVGGLEVGQFSLGTIFNLSS